MKNTTRSIIMLLCLAMLLAFAACAGEKQPDVVPEGTDEAAIELTEAQVGRVNELARAFYEFGECSMTDGVTLARIEGLVRCMYCRGLSEYDENGYGKVSVEDADAMIDSVFRGIKIAEILRTKYDPKRQQDYFCRDGYYYVKQAEGELTCRILSVEPYKSETGKTVGVTVKTEMSLDGVATKLLTLELTNEEENVFSLNSCRISDLL